MIILKPNANQVTSTTEAIDIIDQYRDGHDNIKRVVFASVHIDLFYNPETREVYDYLNNGEEVAIDIFVNGDWLQEQRELEA